MQIYKCDKGKCGIYCIKNTINEKVYVGKAKDIYNRMIQHRQLLRKRSKDENCHLIAAWHKYGEDVFTYYILEEFEFDEQKLREREDYWIIKMNAINRDKGYNIRRDSSTGCLVSEETKKKISKSVKGKKNPNYGNTWTDEQRKRMSEMVREGYKTKERIYNSNATYMGLEARNKLWKENPELKEKMKKKVSLQKTEYSFYQYDKNTMNLIKVWDSIYDILLEHPEWKRHNIYAVCSGEKPSIYGYKWKKILKNEIVQQ